MSTFAADPDGTTQLRFSTIRAAGERIAPYIKRTPVLRSAAIDGQVGARVYAKAEALQRSGSFKVRGAFNRLLTLDAAQRARGIVTYSSGNHGAAVAIAGAELGIPVTVVVPSGAAQVKLDAITAFGAELVSCDPAFEDRGQVAARLANERGLVLVAPYDDYAVMAGQGTIALELIESLGRVDVLVVPVSGGGLLAGIGVAAKALSPAVRVIAVEPSGADDTYRSFRSGTRVSLRSEPETIADGLRARVPGALTFPINARLLTDVVTVSDAEIADAMHVCEQQLQLTVEPSGAASLAAALSGQLTRYIGSPNDVVAVVLSGGNVDADRFAALTASDSITSTVSQHPTNTKDRWPGGHLEVAR